MQQDKNKNNNEVQCHCGKLWKSLYGLRACQRLFQIRDVRKLKELFNNDLFRRLLCRVQQENRKYLYTTKIESKSRYKVPKYYGRMEMM